MCIAPATSASSPSSARARSRPGCGASRRRTRDEARKRLEAERALTPISQRLLRAPAGEAAERLEALIDDKRKLERELADAKRKLAMGGGRARRRRTPCARSAGVKFYARAVERRRHEGSEVARRRGEAEGRLGRCRRSRRRARTARRASSSRSRPISRAASTRSSWCGSARRRSAARAAAGGRTWRRPAVRTARRRRRRWRRSKKACAGRGRVTAQRPATAARIQSRRGAGTRP